MRRATGWHGVGVRFKGLVFLVSKEGISRSRLGILHED